MLVLKKMLTFCEKYINERLSNIGSVFWYLVFHKLKYISSIMNNYRTNTENVKFNLLFINRMINNM